MFRRLKASADDALQEIAEDPDWSHPVRAWWQIRPIWATAALVGLVLLSIPLVRAFLTTGNVYAIVENEDGTQYRLAAGKTVTSDVWTRLTLTLADGSRSEMRSQSALSFKRAPDGMRIRLDKGSIIVNTARQRSGHLHVETKDVVVSVVGTVFLVTVEEAGSRVAVLEGEVQVEQDGSSRRLLLRQQAATNPLMELPSLREQVAWSRYAGEHLALLQQDAGPISAKQVEKPLDVVQTQAKPRQENSPTQAAPRPQFEVASVKRNNSGSREVRLDGSAGRYSATNVPLRLLMQVAYKVEDFQIVGAPGWIDSEHYDIEAKAEGTPSRNEIVGPMLQALIEERFKAVIHGETRDLPVYFLTVAKSGSKLKAGPCITREPNTPIPPGQRQSAFCGFMGRMGDGSLRATGTSIENLADALSGILERKVLDRTGLTGEFDVNLRWTQDLSTPANNPAATADPGPSIFTAIEEQLGLKLESGKAPIDVLVIDHIERPSDN